jgi:hypothetical protein
MLGGLFIYVQVCEAKKLAFLNDRHLSFLYYLYRKVRAAKYLHK